MKYKHFDEIINSVTLDELVGVLAAQAQLIQVTQPVIPNLIGNPGFYDSFSLLVNLDPASSAG